MLLVSLGVGPRVLQNIFEFVALDLFDIDAKVKLVPLEFLSSHVHEIDLVPLLEYFDILTRVPSEFVEVTRVVTRNQKTVDNFS